MLKFYIILAISTMVVFFTCFKILGSRKSMYDDPICCNCWGAGKVTVYGVTITCPYCYGTGHLSQSTYNQKCK